MSHRLLAIAALALIVAGCGGAGPAAHSQKPAWMALAAPHGYRVQHVWHRNLTGGRVRDVIVSSASPPRKAIAEPGRFPSVDLRVLATDSGTGRWKVVFDAQKVDSGFPCTPQTTNIVPCVSDMNFGATRLLDSAPGSSIGQVRFAHLVSRRRDDLVVSTQTLGGADGGFQSVLAVVDFGFGWGAADLAYVWTGARGLQWKIAGRQIRAEAGYFQGIDTPTGTLRTYHFSVAPSGDLHQFAEMSDDRAWLGVTTRVGRAATSVVGIEPNSPALHALQVGDVLVKVLNPPKPDWPPTVDGKIRMFHAGQVAHLLIDRDGRRMVVSVRLGSLKDAIPQLFPFDSRLEGL